MVIKKKAFKRELENDLRELKKLLGINAPREIRDLEFLKRRFGEENVKAEYKEPLFGRRYIKTTIKTEGGKVSIRIDYMSGEITDVKEKGYTEEIKIGIITAIREKYKDEAIYLAKTEKWKKIGRNMGSHIGGVADRES